MHRLLERQLKRHLGKDVETSAEWREFLKSVSAHYDEMEQERALMENALGVNTNELNEANERLRAQNAELTRTMLNTLSDGVYATDLDGRINFMNASAELMLGWKEAELIGQKIHLAIHHTHPDGSTFPQGECPLLHVLTEGISLAGEDHFIHRNGDFVPVSFRANPLVQDGRVIGSLVSFQDIRQRQQAEAQIRLQRAALDAAANMIIITARNGIIEYVNRAFCQTTGYSLEEVIGKHSRILKSGHQSREFYESMWETLLQGLAWEGELTNRRKSGALYPEQMTITPIIEDGEISHFVAIKRDITEEAKTKTRLKLIETAIQNIDQGILITDTDLVAEGMEILYVNAGFSKITGYAPEDVIGHRTQILRGAQTDLALIARLRDTLREGKNFCGETVYYRKDGSAYDVELQFSPVRDDKGRVSHFIGLLSDISPRKHTEEALHKARDQALETSRLKSEFLSTMSHEIRTPMNGIIGMTDLLLDTPLNEEQREFSNIVRDSAQSLLTIINDILDFSKIEAGKMEIEITDFSPVSLVEGAAELLAAKAREKRLSLMTFIDPHLPRQLRGDPTRLRQVLINLIGNAVKFTESGEIHVQVRPGDSDRQLRFEIRDSGIGMSAATRAKLFQSFSQADSSTTRKYGGTGLGLSISKRLVELMGGEIGVESEEGVGSTFWFTLPLLLPLHAAMPQEKPLKENVLGLHVLVVDDHASDRRILHRYLESWGMKSEDSANAGEALRLLHQAMDAGTPYDIALIDYAMPGTNGIELARTIRADHAFDGTRLIMLTAFDQRKLMDDAGEAGYSVCLTKPVRQSQLFDSIAAKIADDEPETTTTGQCADPENGAPSFHDALKDGRLILLAEDNPVNQRVAQLQLGKLGYAVHIVNNGQEAVEAAAALPYAAILMDCQMPVMDGYEAAAMIRKAEQESQRHCPIIAMTANAMQGDRERCIAVGMDDYISKPIDPVKLTQALSSWTTQPEELEARTETVVHTARPAIDFDHLRDLFGDDPQLIGELLEVFHASTATLLDKLHLARTQRDAASIKMLAHEAKGVCANLGITSMSDPAARIENAAAKADWADIEEQCSVLDNAFRQTSLAIHSQRKETT